jgi:hypothetical protein
MLLFAQAIRLSGLEQLKDMGSEVAKFFCAAEVSEAEHFSSPFAENDFVVDSVFNPDLRMHSSAVNIPSSESLYLRQNTIPKACEYKLRKTLERFGKLLLLYLLCRTARPYYQALGNKCLH